MNIEAVFLQLNGREFNYKELRSEVQRIVVSLSGELPAELTTRDLFEAALSKGWIISVSTGLFRINIPLSAEASQRSLSVAAR